jgi:putative hydrolase of the HAD superfamily
MAIKIIGFDADDTLWANEPHYLNTEKYFLELLKGYAAHEEISSELYKKEMENLELYGYGAKGFALSMIETAIHISNGKVSTEEISKILAVGKSLIEMPIELLEDVEQVLHQLKNRYKLIVVTKGDLIDQGRKLRKSGLAHYFDHIEIVSEKKGNDYKSLITHLGIDANEFMMIGNSIKSDILPVLEIGGYAIHIPYYLSWIHEEAISPNESIYYKTVSKLADVLKIL